MSPKLVSKEIDTLLEELFTFDETLRSQEKMLRKIIMKLIEKKPNVAFDSEFRKQLKRALLMEVKRLHEQPKGNVFMRFFSVPTLRYSFVGVVVILIAAGAWFFYNGRLGGSYIMPQKIDTSATVTPVISTGAFSIKPTSSDSMGVPSNTKFVFTSTDAIDAKVITASLQISPSFAYKVESSDTNSFTIVPKDDLNSNTVYSFALAAVKPDDGSKQLYQWAYQVKDTFKIQGTLPRDKATNVPLNTGIEITFSTDKYSNYSDYISFEPKIEGRFQQYRKTLVYVPKSLTPATIYTVTVKKGMPVDGSKETLSSDYIFRFETEGAGSASAYFEKGFYEYPPTEPPVLTLNPGTSMSPKIELYRFGSFDDFVKAVEVQNPELYSWARYTAVEHPVDTSKLTKVSEFDGKVSTVKDSYLWYMEFPESLPLGQYVVQTKEGSQLRQTFLQISQVIATFQGSKKTSVVWAHDLKNGKPLSKASIAFSGNAKFSQSTNADGLAEFETPNELQQQAENRWYEPGAVSRFFTVRTANDSLLIPIKSFYGGYWMMSYAPNNEYWTYLYPNRELYSTTDSVKFWGLVKSRNGGSVAKATAKLESSNWGPQGSQEEVVAERDITISTAGTFQGELSFDHLSPSMYTLGIYIDGKRIVSKSVDVASYTKPTYSIEASASQLGVFVGDPVTFTVTSKFFDGTPVPNLKLAYNGSHGDGTVTTDSQGKATVTKKATFESYPGNTSIISSSYINFHPELSEISVMDSSAGVQVFGSRVGVDISSTNKGAISGSVYAVDLNKYNNPQDHAQQDYRGNPVGATNVKVKVVNQYYNTIEDGEQYDPISKKVTKIYRYERGEKTVSETTVKTGADGKFAFSFKPEDNKSYTVSAEAKDSAGKTAQAETYLYGGSYYYDPSWSRDTYYLTEVGTDAKNTSYKPGQNIQLEFAKNDKRLTQSEQPQFLYFKDHGRLFDVTPSKVPTYSFTYQEAYAPNMYVFGVYFDGRAYHMTETANFPYDSTLKKLAIDIATDKKEYRPKDKVTMTLTVTDPNKKPVNAEVNVSIIDAALAALQWNTSVDTVDSLYANLAPSLTLSYVTHEQPDMNGGAEGGGCFTGETEILMSDGSKKPIADVMVGDTILTRRSSSSDELVAKKVIGKSKHSVNTYLTINEFLNVTPVHIVNVNGTWMPIGKAKIGDTLLGVDGLPIVISSIVTHHVAVNVYNLHVQDAHTFFADGVYVHNEKSGGRTDFEDVAYFGSAQTDANGKATIEFTLPDNVTSWVSTVQAISNDLSAGGFQTNVVSTLPFFVEFSMPKTYLTSDKPVLKVRAFGKDLSAGDAVSFEVSYPDLKKKETFDGKAFEATNVTLPAFGEGEHAVTITARSKNLTDTVTKTATFYSTYLRKSVSATATLTEQTKLEAGPQRTNVTFMNKERGQYYSTLQDLRYWQGDRVDQKLAQVYAQKLLTQYFGDTTAQQTMSFSTYQVAEGGITLLPYSSADLLLSAKAIEVGSSDFDTDALKNYFSKVISSKESNTDEIVYAVLGLANLREPVLIDAVHFLDTKDLKPELKVYLARAIANLGDTESAKTIIADLLKQYGKQQDPYMWLALGETQDDITEYTYHAAIIARMSGMTEAEKLYAYAVAHPAKYQLNVLEQLRYAGIAIPTLKDGSVTFSYTLNGKTQNVSVKNNETYSLSVNSQEAKTITFGNINGTIGVVSRFDVPVTLNDEKQDPKLSLRRSYSVNGKSTTTFKESDIVKITLDPSVDGSASDTVYFVTDYLPSGMTILTDTYRRDLPYDQLQNYPYQINGQEVKFWVGKTNKSFTYYAVVTSKGTYQADQAIIQGAIVKESKAYTNQSAIISIP